MRYNKLVLASAVVIIAVVLTSCNIGKAPEPTPDVNAIYTGAAQTMVADLGAKQTQTAAAIPPTAQSSPTPMASPTGLATFAISTGSVPFGTPLTFGTPGTPSSLLLATPLPAGTSNALLAYSFPVGPDNAAYIGNKPKDKTQVKPGEEFQASFQLVNLGTSTWDENYAFSFLEGDKLSATPDSIIIRLKDDFVKPNEGITFITHMVAPKRSGEYIGYWQMVNDKGVRFGSKVFIDIIVVKEGEDTPTPVTPGATP